MNAGRVIPGRPVQTGTAAARKIVRLLLECLESASAIDKSEAAAELNRALPHLAQLVNAGHLARHELVLVAAKLRLAITCPVGAKALSVDESLTPARGAASADTWRLHIPAPPPYDELLGETCDGCEHLTTDPAPDNPEGAAAVAGRSVINLTALERAARKER